MTLVNLTNQSYFINLKEPYNGSRTLIVMPFSSIVYPDIVTDEKEIRAKAAKKLFRITASEAQPKEPAEPKK